MYGRAIRQWRKAAPPHTSPAAGREASWVLALQRSAGNRAASRVVRSLARAPVVKGGVETKVVSPAVMDLLDAKGVKYAREVTFELIDANGEALVAGRFDVVFRTPVTQELIFPELKGDTLSALTPNQEVYHRLFRQPGGARVRITSRLGGSLHLPTGAVESVGTNNFMIVSTENLNEFTAFVEEAATGVRPTSTTTAGSCGPSTARPSCTRR
jgi:hypothetical protein